MTALARYPLAVAGAVLVGVLPWAATPASGSDLVAPTVHTSAGCPAAADSYYATANGHGFPAAGQIVTAPIAAGMSHSSGFDVYFAQTMRDFAADNHSTLTGRYDVRVYCVDSFTREVHGEFAGGLTFTTATSYVSSGGGAAPGGSAVPAPADSAYPAATVVPAVAAGPQSSHDGAGRTPIWIALALAAVVTAFEAGRRFGRRTTTADQRQH